jgi:hypothetical protein
MYTQERKKERKKVLTKGRQHEKRRQEKKSFDMEI